MGVSLVSHAQVAFMTQVKPFTEAAVVLTTGTILTGTLIFYPEREQISLRCPNDSTYTLPAKLVRGFAVKDAPGQQRKGDTYIALQRIFRVFPLPKTKHTASGTWGFYEQLSRGPGAMLLRREQAVGYEQRFSANRSGLNMSAARAQPTITVYPSEIIVTLYLAMAAGEVFALRKPQDVLKYFPAKEQQLRAYVRENKLNLSNERELSFLVNYANTLVQPTP